MFQQSLEINNFDFYAAVRASIRASPTICRPLHCRGKTIPKLFCVHSSLQVSEILKLQLIACSNFQIKPFDPCSSASFD
ncbi:unnamed protein product, partial [Vitis vinifera]